VDQPPLTLTLALRQRWAWCARSLRSWGANRASDGFDFTAKRGAVAQRLRPVQGGGPSADRGRANRAASPSMAPTAVPSIRRGRGHSWPRGSPGCGSRSHHPVECCSVAAYRPRTEPSRGTQPWPLQARIQRPALAPSAFEHEAGASVPKQPCGLRGQKTLGPTELQPGSRAWARADRLVSAAAGKARSLGVAEAPAAAGSPGPSCEWKPALPQ